MDEMSPIHYSSKSDEWETPPEVFDPLDAEFDFDLDPCATKENRKCQMYFTIADDGLSKPWAELGYRSAYVNPAYSKLKAWVSKCALESKQGMTCVMLIPARTDTKAWHRYIYDASRWKCREGVEVRFLPWRIVFEVDGKPVINPKTGKPQGAPFPSCIVIFRPV